MGPGFTAQELESAAIQICHALEKAKGQWGSLKNAPREDFSCHCEALAAVDCRSCAELSFPPAAAVKSTADQVRNRGNSLTRL